MEYFLIRPCGHMEALALLAGSCVFWLDHSKVPILSFAFTSGEWASIDSLGRVRLFVLGFGWKPCRYLRRIIRRWEPVVSGLFGTPLHSHVPSVEISILTLDLPVSGWIGDSFWVFDPLLVSIPWEYRPG